LVVRISSGCAGRGFDRNRYGAQKGKERGFAETHGLRPVGSELRWVLVATRGEFLPSSSLAQLVTRVIPE